MLDLHRVCDERDSRYDGAFVVAVRTTRIYCRPSCSGRPLPRNRSFLPSPAAARREGYRACKRCRPDEAARLDLGFFADKAPDRMCAELQALAGKRTLTTREASLLLSFVAHVERAIGRPH